MQGVEYQGERKNGGVNARLACMSIAGPPSCCTCTGGASCIPGRRGDCPEVLGWDSLLPLPPPPLLMAVDSNLGRMSLP